MDLPRPGVLTHGARALRAFIICISVTYCAVLAHPVRFVVVCVSQKHRSTKTTPETPPRSNFRYQDAIKSHKFMVRPTMQPRVPRVRQHILPTRYTLEFDF